MCGISGIFDSTKQIDLKVLKRMDNALSHRGPDDNGFYFNKNVALANRRLAIIDVSSQGSQPMKTKDGRFWITFNGEIFNYKQLQKDLLRAGYIFRSQSDTEVILLGFVHFGENIVKKLIGQFAFCIYDSKNKSLFLARDQLGVNPIYYTQEDTLFLFASELKGILASNIIKREIDPAALSHYLSFFSIPAPLTIIKNVKSLLPGHCMWVNENGSRIKEYYEIPMTGSYKFSSEEEIITQLRSSLIESVTSSTVSDVEVGTFLSGGIDSSLVTAIASKNTAKRLKTYSLWTKGNESFDERRYARLVSQQFDTDHHEITVDDEDLVRELPKIIYFFDQPTGGSLESYFVSKVAHKKVKVVLSGLGGDELFGGYHANIYSLRRMSLFYDSIPIQVRDILLRLLNHFPISNNLKKTVNVTNTILSIPTDFDRLLYLYFAYLDKEKYSLVDQSLRDKINKYNSSVYARAIIQKVSKQDIIDQFSYFDLNSYTRDDLLLGVNMMTMANSLEARVPLLDPRLVQFASKIPSKFKYQKGHSKYILKKAAEAWLPKEVIYRKKAGFAVPRARYMKTILKPFILSVLSPSSLEKRGIFHSSRVQKIISVFYNSPSDKMLWNEHLRVWTLFIFELWCRLYIDRRTISVPTMTLQELAS